MSNPGKIAMRMTRFCAVALTMIAWLAGCTSVPPPEHQSQADPETNLGAYRTFGWRPALGAGAGDEPMRMLDVNIRNAISAELTRRGYQEDFNQPQFLVTYETALKDKVRSNPVRIGIGIGSWGSNVGGSVNVGSPSVQSYREGELVIHVLDAAANREVWYGTVSGQVDKSSLDADAVARAVAIALEDFPPRAQ